MRKSHRYDTLMLITIASSATKERPLIVTTLSFCRDIKVINFY